MLINHLAAPTEAFGGASSLSWVLVCSTFLTMNGIGGPVSLLFSVYIGSVPHNFPLNPYAMCITLITHSVYGFLALKDD